MAYTTRTSSRTAKLDLHLGTDSAVAGQYGTDDMSARTLTMKGVISHDTVCYIRREAAQRGVDWISKTSCDCCGLGGSSCASPRPRQFLQQLL